LPEPVAVAAVTVRDALARGAARLAAVGCETPRLDAELLLGSVLEVDRGRLVIDSSLVLGSGELAAFSAAVVRREAREPVAYIVGLRPFRRIVVAVDRRVLIPRPETELLVEVGLSLSEGASVVDVGTGSGAVALALKDERPDVTVVGVDLSGGAIGVARENALDLGLDVGFVVGDLLTGIEGQVDAVLANLPYVPDGDAASLAPEITRYEPGGALYGGVDGLDVVRRLVAMLSPAVSLAALEIGAGQAPVVESLLHGAGFGAVERLRDLAGHERVVVGRR
jgi:release factor glutamine methyltransferase